MKTLPLNLDVDSSSQIAYLQEVFAALTKAEPEKFPVFSKTSKDFKNKTFGNYSNEYLKKVQGNFEIPKTGIPDKGTIESLNDSLREANLIDVEVEGIFQFNPISVIDFDKDNPDDVRKLHGAIIFINKITFSKQSADYINRVIGEYTYKTLSVLRKKLNVTYSEETILEDTISAINFYIESKNQLSGTKIEHLIATYWEFQNNIFSVPTELDQENADHISKLHNALYLVNITGFSKQSSDFVNVEIGDYTKRHLITFNEVMGIDPPSHILGNDTIYFLNKLLTPSSPINIEKFSSQKQILIALKNNGYAISNVELKEGKFGRTGFDSIVKFQKKYGLLQTKSLDINTLIKLDLFAKGKFPSYVATKNDIRIKPISPSLGHNLKHADVRTLQLGLSHLGYKILKWEHDSKTFDSSTVTAVKDFQKQNGLAETGYVNGITAKALNTALSAIIIPGMRPSEKFRVRGSVRDQKQEGQLGYNIRVYNNSFNSSPTLLADVYTGKNGFFDAIYTPETNSDGTIKKRHELLINVLDSIGKIVSTTVIRNATRIQWYNYNIDGNRFAGDSLYKKLYKKISPHLGDKLLTDLREDGTEYMVKDEAMHERVKRTLRYRASTTGTTYDEKIRSRKSIVTESVAIRKDFTNLNAVTKVGSIELVKLFFSHVVGEKVFEIVKKFDGEGNQKVSESSSGNSYKTDTKGKGLSEEEKTKRDIQEIVFGFIATGNTAFPESYFSDKPEEWDTWVETNAEAILDSVTFMEENIQRQVVLSAAEKNVISPRFAQNPEDIIDGLSAIRAIRVLQKKFLAGSVSLNDFLTQTGISDFQQQKQIVDSFIKHKGINEEFWTSVGAVVGEEQLPYLKQAYEIGYMVHYSPTNYNYIINQISSQNNTLSDFAKLPKAEWVNLITNQVFEIPYSVEGNTPEERVSNYADIIFRNTALVMPTLSYVSELNRLSADVAQIGTVISILSNVPKTNLINEDMASFIKANGLNAYGDETIQALRLIQRVQRYTSNPANGKILIENKWHGASQIYLQGRESFVKKATALQMNVDDANKIFTNAEHGYSKLLSFFSEFSPQFNRTMPKAVSSYSLIKTGSQNGTPATLETAFPNSSTIDVPNLEELFGSMDYCTCSECQSVLSPSAYLIDILRFLGQKNSIVPDPLQPTDFKSVKTILFERRPDIGEIALNCENTNTALPHIDLVCEVLENAIKGTPDFNNQTTLSQAELISFPEHVKADVYIQTLMGSHLPMRGNFNLFQETSRMFLRHLGVERWELMASYQNTNAPTNLDIACEYFGISTTDKKILMGTFSIPTSDQDTYWGIDGLSTEMPVELFMEKMKISYEDVLVLLQGDFVQQGNIDKILIDRPLQNPCSISEQKLINLSNNRLDAIHRFMRLLPKTKWNIWELDLLLTSTKVGNGVIDANTIVNLKKVKELQVQLKLSVQELLVFFDDMNTVDINTVEKKGTIKSLYTAFFLNKSFVNPLEGAFEDALNNVNPPISDEHLDYLCASIAKPKSDADYLISQFPPLSSWTLDVANVSKIYRYLTLASILNMKVIDLMRLFSLVNIPDPFVSIDALQLFLEKTVIVKKSGVSLDTLEVMLKGSDLSNVLTNKVILQDDSISKYLIGLRTVIENVTKQIYENVHINSDKAKDLLGKLSNFSTTALIDDAIALIEGNLSVPATYTVTSPTYNEYFIRTYCTEFISLPSDISDAIATFTTISAPVEPVAPIQPIAPLALPASATPAQVAQYNADLAVYNANLLVYNTDLATYNTSFSSYQTDTNAYQNEIKSRYVFFYSQFEKYLIAKEMDTLLSSQFSVDVSVISVFTRLFVSVTNKDFVAILRSSTAPLISGIPTIKDKLLAKGQDGVYTYSLNSTEFQGLFDAYRNMYGCILYLRSLPSIDSVELTWFIDKYAALNTIDFTALPIYHTDPRVSFEKWENLNRFWQIKNKNKQRATQFYSLLDVTTSATSSLSDIINELSSFVEVDTQVLTDIISQLGYSKPDFTNPLVYKRIEACYFAYKRLGVAKISSIVDWIDRDTNQDIIAKQIQELSKSKYEYKSWLEVVKPFQDEIRERKRDALVDYILEDSFRPTVTTSYTFSSGVTYQAGKGTNLNPKFWRNANDMFAYFLIDSQVSSCQLTSRIKQATLSVQLFVQRCFLDLEQDTIKVNNPDLSGADNNWSQWKWMKYYRIWEANRKVFLFPENWIEPDLRDDMSPFFKELRDDLQQHEMTDENAQKAVKDYISKVNDVSHLEVVSTYHELVYQNPKDADSDYKSNYKNAQTSLLHVLACTKSEPSIYYYRNYDLNYETWTAWEKIETDITSQQALITKYNGKLHIFWLHFQQKPLKTDRVPSDTSSSAGSKDAQEQSKMYEIRLNWIRREEEKWTERKMSKQKLIHPWNRPLYSYNLRARLKPSDNTLWIDIFISTSREFNGVEFYNQYTSKKELQTQAPFNEYFRPWHSSSFVYNGNIKELRLRNLFGAGNFFRTYRGIDIHGNSFFQTEHNSFAYVHNNFGEDGRQILLIDNKEVMPKINLPLGLHFENTHVRNNTFNQSYFNAREGQLSVALLANAQGPFNAVFAHQDAQINRKVIRPFFYQDADRAYFVKPVWTKDIQCSCNAQGQLVVKPWEHFKYEFNSFYHPYTQLLLQELNKSSFSGLYSRQLQLKPETYEPYNTFDFKQDYLPNKVNTLVNTDSENDIIDFSFSGANSLYNWELFFHIPMLIANRLTQNQRFEEAMTWFHYIFDPTNIEANIASPQRFWITKPFYSISSSDYQAQRIENILKDIPSNYNAIKAWRNNPFKPHLVARYRLVAYQKNVVMKYLDNLIAWGDMLFTRDTMESNNEALMLYVLAYEILGEKPKKIPGIETVDKTVNDLFNNGVDYFGNASLPLEDILMGYQLGQIDSDNLPYTYNTSAVLPNLQFQYFCVPHNPKLISYWSTVEDRLFKLRHCMNIDGVVRQLPLFEPPIDPALLVKAVAQGVDIGNVIYNLSASPSYYRFRTLVQKAIEYCNEVKGFGDRILSVIEKQDAEALSNLRMSNEISLTETMTEMKKLQIKESEYAIKNLEISKENSEQKREYYLGIPRMNAQEQQGYSLRKTAVDLDIASATLSGIAGVICLIPQFKLGITGIFGSPTTVMETGGKQFSDALNTISGILKTTSGVMSSKGSLLESQGGYTRRNEETKFQVRTLEKEIQQIEVQLTSAEIRRQISENDFESHLQKIENLKAEYEYLKDKYTNKQLYDWMLGQLSGLYFMAYKLAYDMALKAQRAYQYELSLPTSSFIEFGYWDSMRKGLLAGDRLLYSLRRMESAYYDNNKRDFEIAKHISLAKVDPDNLVKLKLTGQCEVHLPELLFDMDYPGQYMRRIKSVSVSIPCITGPYTSVNCKLTLTRSQVRKTTELNVSEADLPTEYTSQTSIATSNAQNDSGVFQLNFSDERFLPFEGAGVISQWTIDLPMETNQFDFDSISDFIFHIHYSAKDGGRALMQEAQNRPAVDMHQLLILKQQFATEWHAFQNPVQGIDNILKLGLKQDHFSYYTNGRVIKISEVSIIINSKYSGNFEVEVETPSTQVISASTANSPDWGGWHRVSLTCTNEHIGEWKMKIKKSGASDWYSSLLNNEIEDILILVKYKAE